MKLSDESCYTLLNAEKERRQNPRSFSIPRSEQRKNLPVGQIVKLIFDPCSGGFSERMWVVVTGKTQSGYVGKLDDTPAFIRGLNAGDTVLFGPEHVVAFTPSGEQLELPFGQTASASRDILQSGAWPVFAVRVHPAKPGDSGWQVFSSKSPQGELVDVSVDELIAKFQVLDSILDEPEGTSWFWSEENLEFSSGK
jgi:hypothetical protein